MANSWAEDDASSPSALRTRVMQSSRHLEDLVLAGSPGLFSLMTSPVTARDGIDRDSVAAALPARSSRRARRRVPA